ncbi:MAG: amidase, partial [Acidobacteria bacterium]|nr:amidase [Acidobacteriota bacterium]
WPNLFRTARLIPAVEYVQANRVRTLLQRDTERAIAGLDGWIAPSFGNATLRLTNLTGHPAVVLPHGFRENGTPTSITFTGALYNEARLLALAKVFQDATGFHLRDAGFTPESVAPSRNHRRAATRAAPTPQVDGFLVGAGLVPALVASRRTCISIDRAATPRDPSLRSG